jgi:predicted  nucleic acid-binding Zn-ribbon protein
MSITKKELITMDRTTSSIKSVLDNLRMQLKILDTEIKAGEKSKLEFERLLLVLETRKRDLETRIKQNTEWGANYDTEVGPIANKYNDMTSQIGEIYENAKKGHSRGIVLLEKEFGYHPAFKRPQDKFTAVPFRPI